MPHVTLTEMEQRGCNRCWYLQKATSWCCRINCVTDNIEREERWRREHSYYYAARHGANWMRIAEKRKIGAEKAMETKRRQKRESDEKRRRLYDLGKSDKEIAAALGVSVSTIKNWRHEQDLPNNAPERRGMPPVDEKERQRRLDAYNATNNDRQAADLIGVSYSTFNHWRTRIEGLPARCRVSGCCGYYLTKEENEQRMNAYNCTDTDGQAAEMCGTSSKAFRSWRRRAGLPPKYGQK